VLIPEAEKYEGENKGGWPNLLEATSSKIAFSWVMVVRETGRGGDRPSKNDSNFDSKLLRIEKAIEATSIAFSWVMAADAIGRKTRGLW